MKYLNRIIFINSADKSLKYAEVQLDGNVHFIGTQGVGKSTLLRAILFFYNADKQKLGIPREKKTFDEFYFPFQNSYIIYEIQTDTAPFCVLAFKAQGRVAFRFFDAAYDQSFFIDTDGTAFDTWDKTRDAFGKTIGSTRIIQNYEEYRNIIYGNNKGLSTEFRKYALIESKQFQNIPRTISNVFLNANLSAEFVKETIIKSLNEDEIKIDLTTYSQTHLKDFETHLNDIKKWTEKGRNGESLVENQALKVAEYFAALKHLEKKKEELAMQLGWALENVKEQHPKELEQLNLQEIKQNKVKTKLQELESIFEKSKSKIERQIGELNGKLIELKAKLAEYLAINISSIIDRVSKKSSLEFEKKNLLKEKEILTSKFIEINERFEAQLRQLENQQKEFENAMNNERNIAQSNFLLLKEELSKQYEIQFEEIKQQHQQEIEIANSLVKEKENLITANKIKRSEIKNTRFHEKEISNLISLLQQCNADNIKAENGIQQAEVTSENLRKEWLIEETGIKEKFERNMEKQNEKQTIFNSGILEINKKIDNSKDSLYGWLNDNIANWEKTIGKVIDEESVLYKSGLNPQKIEASTTSFFGVGIDTNAINKNVKTVTDLQNDKDELNKKIMAINTDKHNLTIKLNEELERLKRRFHSKIKEQKDSIETFKYQIEQCVFKIYELEIKLSELKNKALKEQKEALELIEEAIAKLSEEKTKAEELAKYVSESVSKKIALKKKEKEQKVNKEQQRLNETINKIEFQIKNKFREISLKETEIKDNQKNELNNKGADTNKIEAIEIQLAKIEPELVFIENSRDKVVEFNKDKRELFDNEEAFKNKKNNLEKQLESDLVKQKQQEEKFIQEMASLNREMELTKKTIANFELDLKDYDSFKNSEIYQSIEPFITNFNESNKTELRCVELTNSLKQNYYSSKERLTNLQESINKFVGNFDVNNLFSFKTKFIERNEYFDFADMLKEFLDENKLDEYKTRVEERFAHIIRSIGREVGDLISKEGEISQVIREINNDFVSRQFVTAIKSVELKTTKSGNSIFQLLVDIKTFNDDNPYSLGKADLFSNQNQNTNEKAISLLKQLIKEMSVSKEKEITLSDSFELQFKIVENDNDTGWVEKLTNVGSEGTDVLVKAMINIMLLNVFKERAIKKNKDEFRLHCMMDEIGKLHPNNVKGILKFANDRNILLINSSPTSYNATDYRYTYLLAKDSKNVTSVKRLVRKIPKVESEISNDAK